MKSSGMSRYYPRSPAEMIDHQAEHLLGAIGELYWWLEVLTDYHEPELSVEGWDAVMRRGVLA